MSAGRKIFKKVGRIFLWLLVSIISLVILLYIFINLPVGKRVVRDQVQSYLQKKLKTKIIIGSIDYSLPEWLEMKNIYIEDQRKDTLLYGKELRVDLHMLKLIAGNTDIEKITLRNILVNVNRPATDTVFNFQFIIDAFSGNNPSTPNTDTAELKLTMRKLLLDTVSVNFKDQYGGNDFYAAIKNLDLKMEKFQPDRMKFLIDEIKANGVEYTMRTYKEQAPAGEAVVVDTIKNKAYPLLITAGKLDLRDVHVLLDNKVSGMYYQNKVTHISTSNALFSIGTSMGTADDLLIDTTQIVFVSPKSTATTGKKDSVDASPMPWVFAAKKLNIHSTDIKYDDQNSVATEGMDFAHLNVKKLNTAILGFHFSKDTTAGVIDQLAFSDTSGFVLDTAHLSLLFTNKQLLAKDIYVKTPQTLIQRSVAISYDSLKGITTSPQNSLVDVKLDHSVIAFNDLFLLVPALKKTLGGFVNQYININTELKGTLEKLDIPYFQVAGLSGSKLNAKGTLYNITDTSKIAFDIYILQSQFFKRDFIKFVPPANLASFKNIPDVFSLSGRITGNKNDIGAVISTKAKDFAFAGKINLKSISNPAKLKYDIVISSLTVDKNMITGFIPPETLATIELPQKITAAGTLTGNTENVTADMKVNTSYGDLKVKGYVKNMKNTQAATYDLVLSTSGFEAGKLLKQDSVLGNIAGTFSFKGTGFDYKNMRSSIVADIASAKYKNYNYQNAKIKVTFDNGDIVSTGEIDDPALKLNYDITANVKGEYPTMKGLVRVDTVQLKELHFYDDTLNLSLTANINTQNLKPRNLDATLLLDSISMQVDNNYYRMDTISLVGSSSAGIDSIVLKSPFAEIHAGGAFDYDKVALSVEKYINAYYKIPGYTPPTVAIPDQQIAVNGIIKNSPVVTAFVPGLSYKDISFDGAYTSASADSALRFNANTAGLTYASTGLSNATAVISSSNGKINYEVKFDTLTTGTNTLYATSIKGTAANDSISLTARTEDITQKEWFAVSGTAAVSGERYSFRLKDTLLLNYERWNVAADNYISYSPNGIIVNNLLLRSDTASISAKSKQLVENSPIDIVIDNFNLKSISSLLSEDTLLMSGIVDVNANVSDLDKELPAFTGNASITDLQFMQHPLGDLTASAQKESDDNIVAKMSILGNGNDIVADGKYYLNETENQFDASLQLRKLNFKTIEAFSGGQIKDASGNISGEIKANGKFSDPRWNGQIDFDTTSFTLAIFGSPYKINKQKIVFEYPAVKFGEFTITDSMNHALKINGDVIVKSINDMVFNVDLNAKDFIFVNAKKSLKSQLYGYGVANVYVSITGTATNPNIDGDIRLNNKTDLTIVLPESSYEKNDGRTIVRFIDSDTFDFRPVRTGFEESKKQDASFGQFLNYNLNISISKNASLSMLLDPSTGDEIKVKGDANLNAGVDRAGNIVIAGTYQLDQGYYDMHYQLLRRKFDLQRGSSITFAGAPLDAYANITAVYVIKTSSRNLLSSQVNDASSTLNNSLNQQIPYRVILKLSGQLNKPEIAFDIELPEEHSEAINAELRTAVENKLQQIRSDPAAINKQVFSLLLFGQFVSEQSSDFFKGSGTDFSSLARQSVSEFLSSAMNQIADDLFKGIDVDLNLNSYDDYSSGASTQRTDLNVAVSKSFANDRITVRVGENFRVEGQDPVQAGTTNNAYIPDIAVSYKLTRDGRYLLRAYTQNQYEVTVSGYMVETGLAFVMTMDYEKFKEIFQRNRKRSSKK